MEIASNRTLGDIPGNYRLRFECNNSPHCYFSQKMDVDKLTKRFGESFVCADLYQVLECPECGARDKFLTIHTPIHFSYPYD